MQRKQLRNYLQIPDKISQFSGCFKKEYNLLWVTEKKSWHGAKDYCADRRLSLFDLMDGNIEIGLLESYPKYIDIESYGFVWVGVKKNAEESWRSLGDEDVGHFIKWNSGQPQGRRGEDYLIFNVAVYHQNGLFGHDSVSAGLAPFFCY